MNAQPDRLPNFRDEQHLLPAIAQDAASGRVLMLGWMNEEAYSETVKTACATYYSRSRQQLWKKGESSGHVQRVKQICIDCDGDTILLRVEQVGAACHQGYASCFFREHTHEGWREIESPLFDPRDVYGDDTQRKK